ncbi:hypothetical protein, partial [Nonomuraea sp. NPDC049784]|uniref:hypothetical protein n=1 Tax=Nonomuraea sp. NPDC049784 TaxID=3154361 RepID=UPI0033D470DF
MTVPPTVKVLPHAAGYVLAVQLYEDGTWQRAYVTWNEVAVRNFRGGIQTHTEWLPASAVKRLANEDYSSVQRFPAGDEPVMADEMSAGVDSVGRTGALPGRDASGPVASSKAVQSGSRSRPAARAGRAYDDGMFVPPEWPPEVLTPDKPDWESSAVAWLLDTAPAEYRDYQAVRRYPVALARMVAGHVDAAINAARASYRLAAHDLRGCMPASEVEAVRDAYRREGPRLIELARSIAVVQQALLGEAFVSTLRQGGRRT